MKKIYLIVFNVILLFAFLVADYVNFNIIMQWVQSFWGMGRGIVFSYNVFQSQINVLSSSEFSDSYMGGLTLGINLPLLCVLALVIVNIVGWIGFKEGS